MGGRVRNTGKYYRVHFLSCDGIMWNHTGAGYREYSRKGREDEKEVERFSRFCEEFANYEREPGQDMTLLVTADGKAVKKIYYTRIFYDRIAFQTQGSYIPPVYGNRGDDIREEMSRIPEPERPGYIFLGWEPELPETMPEGELTVHALWEPGESQYTVLRWMVCGGRRVFAAGGSGRDRKDRGQNCGGGNRGASAAGGQKEKEAGS